MFCMWVRVWRAWERVVRRVWADGCQCWIRKGGVWEMGGLRYTFASLFPGE
jgi:hypothetical protein